MFASLKNLVVATVALGATVSLVGCNDGPEPGSGAEPFTKLTDQEKLEKIKTMPISPQMKADGIRKLNLSEEEKQRAIAELGSAPAATSGVPPSSPGSSR